MHMDAQQITALGIVAVAAAAVGRRMYTQIAGFWNSKSAGCGGCDGCGPKKENAAPSPPTLVQIQIRPPKRIQRPSDNPK